MKKKVFKLPTLPNAQSDLIDQYLVAFDKVFSARESILSAYQSGDIKVELADIVACLEAMRAA